MSPGKKKERETWNSNKQQIIITDMLQKNKERNEVEIINSLLQSSICVFEVLTYLISIGAKRNVSCCSESQKRKSLSNIAPQVIIVGGGEVGNPAEVLIPVCIFNSSKVFICAFATILRK